MTATKTRYNVVCESCGSVFTPGVGSSLWWRAKKRDEAGFLDALHVLGTECGCVEKRARPDAPFRVFGYDGDCVDFDIPFNSFTAAVQTYRRFSEVGDIVFIDGVSDAVLDRLRA